jgi:hypothetical protein
LINFADTYQSPGSSRHQLATSTFAFPPIIHITDMIISDHPKVNLINAGFPDEIGQIRSNLLSRKKLHENTAKSDNSTQEFSVRQIGHLHISKETADKTMGILMFWQ